LTITDTLKKIIPKGAENYLNFLDENLQHRDDILILDVLIYYYSHTDVYATGSYASANSLRDLLAIKKVLKLHLDECDKRIQTLLEQERLKK